MRMEKETVRERLEGEESVEWVADLGNALRVKFAWEHSFAGIGPIENAEWYASGINWADKAVILVPRGETPAETVRFEPVDTDDAEPPTDKPGTTFADSRPEGLPGEHTIGYEAAKELARRPEKWVTGTSLDKQLCSALQRLHVRGVASRRRDPDDGRRYQYRLKEVYRRELSKYDLLNEEGSR